MKLSKTYQFSGGATPAFRYIFFVTAKPLQKRMPLQSGAQMVDHDIAFLEDVFIDYYKNA